MSIKTMAFRKLANFTVKAYQTVAPVVRSLPKSKKARIIAAGASAIGLGGAAYLSMSDDEISQVSDEQFGQLADQLSARIMSPDGSIDAANALAAMIAAAAPEERSALVDSLRSSASADDEDALALLMEQVSALTSSVKHTGDSVTTPVEKNDMEAYRAVKSRMAMLSKVMAALRLYNPEDLIALRAVMFMDHDEFMAAVREL